MLPGTINPQGQGPLPTRYVIPVCEIFIFTSDNLVHFFIYFVGGRGVVEQLTQLIKTQLTNLKTTTLLITAVLYNMRPPYAKPLIEVVVFDI
jgi:hypothetical protein